MKNVSRKKGKVEKWKLRGKKLLIIIKDRAGAVRERESEREM